MAENCPDRWKLIGGLFDEAIQQPEESRDAWLREACGGDESLYSDVAALLLAHRHSDGVLEELTPDSLWQSTSDERELPARERFKAGTVLAGRYEVVELLGRGGMGEVYRARDPWLGRDVALKALPEQRALDPRAVRRFEREVKAVAALSHPNVLSVYDVGFQDEIPFAVMELLEGRSLRDVLRDLPLAPHLFRRIVTGIAAALACAHEAGIVHRDIKPENVMVSAQGHVKVLDFGLARLIPSMDDASEAGLTKSGANLGTAPYMSPEQARGEELTELSDIFSLGIVLYELATGSNPFDAGAMYETLQRIVWETPAPIGQSQPDFPADLERLVFQMLEKDAARRPDASSIEAALREVFSDSTSTVRLLQRSAADSGPATVGRDASLRELTTAFQEAAEGRGRMVLVSGEAGIGKTTVVGAFLHDLASEQKQCIVARGGCSERLAGTDAYLPFLESLEALRGGEGGARAMQLLRQVAPSWYVQMPQSSSDQRLTGDELAEARGASQERMRREFLAFLQELSRVLPIVLFFDDLHWSDVSTVDLLTYIASRGSALRLLIVGSYRPTELALGDHPFLHAKLELQGRGFCKEIPLEFLTLEHVAEYLAVRHPENRFPRELAELIYSRTDGSPLFMVDLLGYMEDSGVIAEKDGCWELVRSLPELRDDPPESIRSMIQRKIDRLDEDDRRLLLVASVQGAEFHAAVVARTLGVDEAVVEDRLDALDRVHSFVRVMREEETPDGTLTVRYSFVHVLYQNVFYATLTPARRAKQSAAVAGAIEQLFAQQRSDVALELALLYEAARDFERASECFLLAAQSAAHRHGMEEAASLAQRAMDMAEKLQGEGRSGSLLDSAFCKAQIFQKLARYDDAIAVFDLAEDVALESGNTEARVEAICGKATCYFYLKKMDLASEHGERALALARYAELEVGAAQAESVIALERLCVGDFEQAERCYDRAIPVLKQKGRPSQAMDAVSFRLLLHAWRLEYPQLEAGAKWWLEMARELGGNLVQLNFSRSMSLGNEGKLSEAITTVQEGRRLAELNDDPYHITRLPNIEGWLYRELQDHERAVRLDRESEALGKDLGFEEAEANARVNLAQSYTILGDYDRALEQLNEAERLFREDVWFRWRYNIRLQAQLASYWIARGDLGKARTHAQASLEQARASVSRKHIAWANKLLADVLVLEDQVEAAERCFEASRRALAGHPCPTIEWKVLHAHAQVSRLRGDSNAADKLRAEAMKIVERLAGGVHDATQRDAFLNSRVVEDLRAGRGPRGEND